VATNDLKEGASTITFDCSFIVKNRKFGYRWLPIYQNVHPYKAALLTVFMWVNISIEKQIPLY